MDKGRALRIDAKLPHYLWPECFAAGVYLANRTPTYRLGWDSPLSRLAKDLKRDIGRDIGLPSLAHLVAYGSRAYVHKKDNELTANRARKLAPRAHIGYLVGYDSTNIFRVWIPHLKTVIRTRDVVFDKTKKYNPDNPYIKKLLQESVENLIKEINIPESDS